MEDQTHKEVNNIARKKKRRSSFIDRHLLGNASLFENPLLDPLENDVVKVPVENPSSESIKVEEVNEYLDKLKTEKKKWIDYEKCLHSKYSRTKKCEMIDLNKYLDYLPKRDRDFLEILDKKLMQGFQDFTFEKYFENENWDSDEFEIENFTEEYCTEDQLYIEGV
ncbi:hypothetical protein O3M35_003364 [Rhynocoris fuscipes]|uniref:Uncharacterized protein n=1 Tax=Rhynocoris fuscipes TaxID=488301 RepID=A0AAW1CQK5_9HEMI